MRGPWSITTPEAAARVPLRYLGQPLRVQEIVLHKLQDDAFDPLAQNREAYVARSHALGPPL
jgi:hypothetical protein